MRYITTGEPPFLPPSLSFSSFLPNTSPLGETNRARSIGKMEKGLSLWPTDRDMSHFRNISVYKPGPRKGGAAANSEKCLHDALEIL